MHHDPAYVAGTINTWAELPGVGKLSKGLTDKLDLLSSVNHAESYVPVPDLTELSPANMEQVISDHAQKLAAESQFVQARQAIRTVVVSSVLDAARAEIPAIVEKLTPGFDAAAETYVDAVAKLPEELTSGSLVAAGPDVLAAYHEAVGAAALLATVDSWVARMHNVTGGGVPDQSVRIVAPHNRRELEALDRARTNTRHDPMVKNVVPVFLTAARLEIPFEIRTSTEAQALRAEIESQPIEDAPRIRGQW